MACRCSFYARDRWAEQNMGTSPLVGGIWSIPEVLERFAGAIVMATQGEPLPTLIEWFEDILRALAARRVGHEEGASRCAVTWVCPTQPSTSLK